MNESEYDSIRKKRFKRIISIPKDTEKGFPLLEIQQFEQEFDSLILSSDIKDQLERILSEFKHADILENYNLGYKKKILLCGKPGTGKTLSAQIISYLRTIKRDKKINISKAAKASQGLSPADIKMITNEAIKTAIIDSRNILNVDDLETAIKQFIRREKVKQSR